MKIANTFIVAGVWLLTVSCGSSDNNSDHNNGDAGIGGHATVGGNAAIGGHAMVGGNAPIGGHMGTGGNASAGGNTGANGTGTCNVPACLTNFGSNCVPSGTCVTQVDLQTFASNTCYSNGVKLITTVDIATSSITSTAKNGGTTCYSFSIDETNTGSITLKNASGATVATLTTDANGNDVVTCAGEQPVVLDSSCSNNSTVVTSANTSDCTDGVCTP